MPIGRAQAIIERIGQTMMQHEIFGSLDWTPSALGSGAIRLPTVHTDLAQNVPAAAGLVAQAEVLHKVDDLAQALLVQSRVGVILGQHTLERGVVVFDGQHRVV